MAIVRCDKCGLNQNITIRTYHNKPLEPIGYPETGVICGKNTCTNPGQVWLETNEYNDYKNGERYFNCKTFTVKVRLK